MKLTLLTSGACGFSFLDCGLVDSSVLWFCHYVVNKLGDDEQAQIYDLLRLCLPLFFG